MLWEVFLAKYQEKLTSHHIEVFIGHHLLLRF